MNLVLPVFQLYLTQERNAVRAYRLGDLLTYATSTVLRFCESQEIIHCILAENMVEILIVSDILEFSFTCIYIKRTVLNLGIVREELNSTRRNACKVSVGCSVGY